MSTPLKDPFSHLVGNTAIKASLCKMMRDQTASRLFLFSGPQGVGKSLFAEAFGRHLLMEGGGERKMHPDLHIYRPEGKSGTHSIQSMRSFCEEVYYPPMEAKWKVFILHDAERMQAASANALLKTFEEPAQDAVIILLTSQPFALIPTILSRCCPFNFKALSLEEIRQVLEVKFGQEEALRLASLSSGSLARALQFQDKAYAERRQKLLQFVQGGKVRLYNELAAFCQELAKQTEAGSESEGESIKSAYMQQVPDKLTALQKEALEKDTDGAAAVQLRQLAKQLLEIVISWYRDLHLIHSKGDVDFLANPDFLPELQASLEKSPPPPLDKILKVGQEALTALERSTSLHFCLENVFLKLGFL